MSEQERLRALLEEIFKGICDHEDQVEVRLEQGEQTSLYTVYCARDDLGQAIGKKGATVQAIRKIMLAAAAKFEFRAALNINE